MNSKKNILIIAVIVVIAVVIILLVSKQEQQGITIGAVLPLTGDIASYGKRAQKGIELALSEVSTSKENPIKINVDFQDSAGSAQEAVSIMKKFCSINRYPVVIGEAASSVSMAIAPIANQYKIVQISPISSSPELTERGGDYFFRVCPSDAFQAVILAEWMREKGIKNVGILFIQNSWGQSLKDKFVEEFQSRGGTIAIVESCKEGDHDFRTQITKIISLKPEAFYCPTYGKEGGLILKQLKELGFNGFIFGSDVWSSPELLTSAGNAAEGVFLVKPAEYTGTLYQEFRKKYLAKYGEEPDVYAAYSYDIVGILHRAFKANCKTGSDVQGYLLKMSVYDGVTGRTQFDKNGDCNSKLFIKSQIMNGQMVQAK